MTDPAPQSAGQARLDALAAGGFNTDEVNEYRNRVSGTMSAAGFNQGEINNYWGVKTPDTSGVQAIASDAPQKPGSLSTDNPDMRHEMVTSYENGEAKNPNEFMQSAFRAIVHTIAGGLNRAEHPIDTGVNAVTEAAKGVGEMAESGVARMAAPLLPQQQVQDLMEQGILNKDHTFVDTDNQQLFTRQFEQYAKPGESIVNNDDRAAVLGRMMQDGNNPVAQKMGLQAKYGYAAPPPEESTTQKVLSGAATGVNDTLGAAMSIAYAVPGGVMSPVFNEVMKENMANLSPSQQEEAQNVIGLTMNLMGLAGMGELGGEMNAIRTARRLGPEFKGAGPWGGAPTAQAFPDAALAVNGKNAEAEVSQVLRNIYIENGTHPSQVAAAAKADPTIPQDLAAGQTPKAYQPPAPVVPFKSNPIASVASQAKALVERPVPLTADRAVAPEVVRGPDTVQYQAEGATKEELFGKAEELKPQYTGWVSDVTNGIKGAEPYKEGVGGESGVRVKNEEGRIDDKIADKNGNAGAVSDYLGGAIEVANPKAMQQVLERIRASGAKVIEVEDMLSGDDKEKNDGYRAIHMQVELEPGFSAELQIIPKSIAKIKETLHPEYVKLRDAEGNETPASEAARQAMVGEYQKAFDKFSGKRTPAEIAPKQKYPSMPKEIKNPVLRFIKARGGIERGSPLDIELKEGGNISPRWYAKKGQGLKAADNFPLEEWQAQIDAGKDDGNGNVSEQYVIDAVKSEMAGNPVTRDLQKIIDEHGHDPDYAAHIRETESQAEQDRINSEITDYHENELKKAEEKYQERLAISGEKEEPIQTRTEEDLENELRQENAAAELRAGETANERPEGNAGAEAGGQQRSEQRGAVAQPAGGQGELAGTTGSGTQLAAAHEGRRIRPTVAQKAPDEGLFDTGARDQGALFEGRNEYEQKPTFYSALSRNLESLPQGKGSPEQWQGIIRNLAQKGVKQEEIDWSGVQDWLKEQKGSVSKQQVMDYLKANELQVQEVVKGGRENVEFPPADRDELKALLKNHDNLGFDSANEALAAIREHPDWKERWDVKDERMNELGDAYHEIWQTGDQTKFQNYQTPGGENYRELLMTLPTPEWLYPGRQDAPTAAAAGQVFRGGHFAEPNVIAHLRFNERTDAEGKKVMMIEEIQSDWHQKGRKEGYKGQGTEGWTAEHTEGDKNTYGSWTIKNKAGDVIRQINDEGAKTEKDAIERAYQSINARFVPDAPFKTTWPELAFKRALRYAVENGFDKMAWTTGEQQAERYDLSKHLDSVQWAEHKDGTFSIGGLKNGEKQIGKDGMKPEELPALVGKDLAEKIIEAAKSDGSGEFKGVDLKVGGEGMKGFYDKILPATVNKLVKKWGAKVGQSDVEAGVNTRDELNIASSNALRNFGMDSPQYREAVEAARAGAKPKIETVHSVEITPEMRESVMQGQPLFEEKNQYESLEQKLAQPAIKSAASSVLKKGKADGNEHAVVVDKDGKRVWDNTSGHNDRVSNIPRYNDAANPVSIVHNHPSGSALSGADIAKLSEKGIAQISAHTPQGEAAAARLSDGMRKFIAGRDAAYEKELSDVWKAGKEAAMNVLQRAINMKQTNVDNAFKVTADIVNRALSKRGIIDYHSDFPLDIIPKDLLDRAQAAANDMVNKSANEKGYPHELALRSPEPILSTGEGTGAPENVAGASGQPPGNAGLRGQAGGAGGGQGGGGAYRGSQTTQERVLEKISVGPRDNPRQPLSWNKFYAAAVDRLDPVFRIQEEWRKGNQGAALKDTYKLLRNAAGSFGRARQFIEGATFKFDTYENNGKGLKDIVAPVRGDMQGLRAYATARTAIEDDAKGLKTGIPIDAAKEVIANGAAKYEPIFKELNGYNDRLLQYLVDSGVLTKDAADAMRGARKAYMPLNRVMDEDNVGLRAGGGKIKNPIMKRRGSERTIIDPIESMVANTYKYIGVAEKNAAAKSFYDWASAQPNAEELFSKQPPVIKPTKISDEEMKAFLTKEGITDLPEGMMTVFRAMKTPLAADEFGFFDKGKWTVLKVDPELAEAFNLTPRAMHPFLGTLLGKALAIPPKGLRYGLIVPEFLLRHLERNSLSSFVVGEKAQYPFEQLFTGLFSYIKKDQWYQDFLKSGGYRSAVSGLTRSDIGDQMKRLTGEYPAVNMMQKVWNLARSPGDIMHAIQQSLETANNLGSFKNALRGLNVDKNNLVDAGYYSRNVTPDPSRIGSMTSTWNALTALANTEIQHTAQLFDALKHRPIPTLAKGFAVITLPTFINWYANHNDPSYKNAPSWEKDAFWIIPTGGFTMRIPKPFLMGFLFGTVPEHFMDVMAGDDPHLRGVVSMVKDMFEQATPNVIPNALMPVLEQITNHSMFRAMPLVPQHLMDGLPEYRYSPYTSELTKAIGRMVGKVPYLGMTSNAAPLVIDNYLRQWTGAYGTYVKELMDYSMRKSGVLPDPLLPADSLADIPFVRAFVLRYPDAQAQPIMDFQDSYRNMTMVTTSYKNLIKEGNYPEALKLMGNNPTAFFKLDGINKALNEHNQLVHQLYKAPDIKPDEKRQLIEGLYYHMIQIADEGNKIIEDINYPQKKAVGQ